MVSFNNISDKLTIRNIYYYTYSNHLTETRFEYSDRDVLPSRFKIVNKLIYKKNKQGEFSTPEERLVISSTSAPQYKPYTNSKSKKSQKQMKYKHTYDIIMCIQPINDKHEYSLDSKIIWRIGSYKKYKKAPQSQVKSIYRETREKLNKRFSKFKNCKERVEREIEKIKKSAPYLCDSDYQCVKKGIYLDSYFRDYYIQQLMGCLYGPCWHTNTVKGIEMPFFDKHMLCIILALLKKGILKY